MSRPLAVAAIGGFHVGGRPFRLAGAPTRMAAFAPAGPARPFDPNGDFVVGQMYVQYVRLAAPASPVPLLLWHGGGMTGVTWEDTPDGRPGWQQHLLEAGRDVYVADAVERGRASWVFLPGRHAGRPRAAPDAGDVGDVPPRPAVGLCRPLTLPRPAVPGRPAGGLSARQVVPRWPGNEAATTAAYAALLDRVGRSDVVAHSQGCGFALAAARGGPDRVAACVLLELLGAPDPAELDLRAAARVPHLVVWGDFFAGSAPWQGYRAAFERYAARLSPPAARSKRSTCRPGASAAIPTC